jgi:two-component system sensor histidine kinase PilS (NtrC family)
MRTGILVVDQENLIRMANSSAEGLLGDIPLHDQPSLVMISPAVYERLLEWRSHPQMHHKSIQQGQGLPDIQPGFRKLEEVESSRGDVLIFLEDATQLSQRFQQMKLASLGRLTASIAHEIRNPLSAINHASQLLSESQLDISDQRLTHIITTQVQRLDKIVQNILGLSRQRQVEPEYIKLYDWLVNFREEFVQINGLRIDQLIIDVSPGDLSILFDPSQLHQVIGNICGNVITHSNRELGDIELSLLGNHDEFRDQPYLDIIDNGPGIDEQTVEQIFDPFFTTSSKGTGLGLFITREMIESNRGKIQYQKRDQSGSCFRIYFLTGGSHKPA